jgi:site-specific recombinase XerD
MNELISLEKIAQWQKLKTLVLDSVSSPITKRVYNMALEEFMAWFQQAPRPGFTKATVSAWRVSLEDRRLGSSSIIIRMSAIRKLAAEAADNGLLAPELAAGISRVKSAKTQGIRVGNWLSLRQAQVLLSAPDITTLRGLRDRAILAVLLGCGLRRSEVAALTFGHLQQRDGRSKMSTPRSSRGAGGRQASPISLGAALGGPQFQAAPASTPERGQVPYRSRPRPACSRCLSPLYMR